MITATICIITMREMIDLNLIALFVLRDQIADAANGVYLNLGAVLGKLLAETMNVNLNFVRCDVSGMPKDVVFDLLLGHDAPFTAHQEFEHLDLAGREKLGAIVYRGLAAPCVELKISDAKIATEQLPGPSQLRFQPRDQFLQRERF